MTKSSSGFTKSLGNIAVVVCVFVALAMFNASVDEKRAELKKEQDCFVQSKNAAEIDVCFDMMQLNGEKG